MHTQSIEWQCERRGDWHRVAIHLFVRKWSANTQRAGKERKSNYCTCLAIDDNLHRVCLRLSVCQLSCQSTKVFDSEMDAIRWFHLTHYIDAVPLQTATVALRSMHVAIAITCTGGWWLHRHNADGRKIHFIYFNSLINNYANAVERALSVFCHFGIDCGRHSGRQEMQRVWTEGSAARQRSRHIYCKSQWRHMYSMSCDIFNALNCGMFRLCSTRVSFNL